MSRRIAKQFFVAAVVLGATASGLSEVEAARFYVTRRVAVAGPVYAVGVPAPVVVAPVPVYLAPAPVYVAPAGYLAPVGYTAFSAPVPAAPAPVFVAPVYGRERVTIGPLGGTRVKYQAISPVGGAYRYHSRSGLLGVRVTERVNGW
jgi:hypothetical protein